MDASGLPSEQAGALPNLMSPTGPPRAASDDPVDAENVPLPPLAELLDDTDHFRTFNNSNGTKRHECLWCHKECSTVTKLLAHVNKVRNRGVTLCTTIIPEQHRKRYWDLWEKKEGKKISKLGEYFALFYTISMCTEYILNFFVIALYLST